MSFSDEHSLRIFMIAVGVILICALLLVIGAFILVQMFSLGKTVEGGQPQESSAQ